MMKVTVDNIVSEGWYGGAYFNATCTDGKKHFLKADYKVMPRTPFEGEVWSVDGTPSMYKGKKQLQLTHAMLERPSGRLFIDMVAKSRLFKGIGTAYATALYVKHGEEIYGLLDKGDPEPFIESLPNEYLANLLVYGWKEIAISADTYKWLDRNGVDLALAKKLVAIYGDDTVEIIEENPYRLLAFLSWDKVESLARAGCISKPDDDRRLVAAVDAAVFAEVEQDHTWIEEKAFRRRVKGLLGIKDDSTIDRAIGLAEHQKAIIKTKGGIQGIGPWSMESYIAERLKEMTSGKFTSEQASIRTEPDIKMLNKIVSDFESAKSAQLNTKFKLNREQQDAIQAALTEPVSIICGGAGVGKTTVLEAICEGTEKIGGQAILMALSGRAARRMEEATGRKAMTIMRFLNMVDAEKISLEGDPTIIIDECSMVDLPYMYRILRRMVPGCRLLLVGDPGQLPPISFGLVFHELVKVPWITKITLTEILRASAASGIPQFSVAIRPQEKGGAKRQMPAFSPYDGKGAGVSFIECEESGLHDVLLKVAKDLGGFRKGIRVLTQLKGTVKDPDNSRFSSASSINQMFYEKLAQGRQPEKHGFALSEPVIWMKNNYDLELMNGTLGFVRSVSGGIEVVWDDGIRKMEILDHMERAYAITIHKSQGSQFDRVIIPIFKSKYHIDSTMLYTAVTRAKQQVVLVGSREAYEKAVLDPPRPSLRNTGIQYLV